MLNETLKIFSIRYAPEIPVFFISELMHSQKKLIYIIIKNNKQLFHIYYFIIIYLVPKQFH